jgi:hypothetical protein
VHADGVALALRDHDVVLHEDRVLEPRDHRVLEAVLGHVRLQLGEHGLVPVLGNRHTQRLRDLTQDGLLVVDAPLRVPAAKPHHEPHAVCGDVRRRHASACTVPTACRWGPNMGRTQWEGVRRV